MPAKGPVRIVWQIVFIFIPFVNLWAFYRIKKLRKFLLMVFIPEGVISLAIILPLVVENVQQALEGNPMTSNESIAATIVLYIVEIGFTILAIYLIYKWSKEWNTQFSGTGNIPV
jgi:hypothetical protein